jgi:hypothetical protein
MTQILLISNPFNPLHDIERFQASDGITPREWLAEHFGPEFEEFDRPTVLQWNGELVMRADWATRQFQPGDVAAFVHVPQGIEVLIVALIVAVVVGVAAYLLMPDPKIPTDQTQSPDSVYTLRGQTNRFRPNEPIEVMYGKCRHWPSYAARPYSEYIGNQQYQYSLFCIGQGRFDFESIMLDDTPVDDFTEVEIEIIQPGGTVDLIEANVFTAIEVSNIELLGPNEDDYTGVSGPFVVNDADNDVKRLAVDISFPQGLYKLDDEGDLQSQTVELLFEYREIDADADPIGTWQTLANPTVSRKDNTPQRITYSTAVPAGRYQVRGRRVSDKPGSTRVSSQVRWETVKGYAKLNANFGSVTLIAMKALATNSLNDSSSKRFNVVATRKLPQWNAVDGWVSAIDSGPTRNPIWAFCDIFRSAYGAKLSSEFLDMPTLAALAATYETREDWFDWIFDGSLTVWEAAKMPLRVGRALPVPQGSLITAVRDVSQSLPAAVFNQHNIVKGSLKKTLQMYDFQPFDGVIVEYTDPDTWQTKEVSCVLPGRAGLNLDRVKFPGCTRRKKAYQEGMYIQTRREFQRKTVTFQTGLEGHIPAFMDLISITHDTLRVGQGGMILAYNSGTNEMTLSEQVNFATTVVVHKIAIRGDDGAIMGTPITCTPGSAPNKVILASDPPETLDFSENRVPPLYAFGVADVWAFMGKISAIRPIDENTVEISCMNYVPAVYGWEDSEVIDAVEVKVIKNRSNPTVQWVTIAPVPEKAERAYIDWPPVAGAVSYILQTSYDDGATWNPAGNFAAPPVEIGTNPGTLIARVAPFALNGNVIYTQSAPFIVGSNINPPPAPELNATQPAFTGLTATVKWGAVNGANGYIADIYTGGILARSMAVGSALRADYSFDDYTADGGTGRAIEFRVKAFNAGGSGASADITRTNPAPASAPASLAVGSPTGTDYPATWTYGPTEGDELEFRVYASTVSGFTPGAGNLIATRTTLDATIPAPTRPLYWRVAVVDKWGPELTLSTEAVIP